MNHHLLQMYLQNGRFLDTYIHNIPKFCKLQQLFIDIDKNYLTISWFHKNDILLILQIYGAKDILIDYDRFVAIHFTYATHLIYKSFFLRFFLFFWEKHAYAYYSMQ